MQLLNLLSVGFLVAAQASCAAVEHAHANAHVQLRRSDYFGGNDTAAIKTSSSSSTSCTTSTTSTDDPVSPTLYGNGHSRSKTATGAKATSTSEPSLYPTSKTATGAKATSEPTTTKRLFRTTTVFTTITFTNKAGSVQTKTVPLPAKESTTTLKKTLTTTRYVTVQPAKSTAAAESLAAANQGGAKAAANNGGEQCSPVTVTATKTETETKTQTKTATTTETKIKYKTVTVEPSRHYPNPTNTEKTHSTGTLKPYGSSSTSADPVKPTHYGGRRPQGYAMRR